jgi:hypothetical protein
MLSTTILSCRICCRPSRLLIRECWTGTNPWYMPINTACLGGVWWHTKARLKWRRNRYEKVCLFGWRRCLQSIIQHYEQSVADHLSKILGSDDHSVIISSAKYVMQFSSLNFPVLTAMTSLCCNRKCWVFLLQSFMRNGERFLDKSERDLQGGGEMGT